MNSDSFSVRASVCPAARAHLAHLEAAIFFERDRRSSHRHRREESRVARRGRSQVSLINSFKENAIRFDLKNVIFCFQAEVLILRQFTNGFDKRSVQFNLS